MVKAKSLCLLVAAFMNSATTGFAQVTGQAPRDDKRHQSPYDLPNHGDPYPHKGVYANYVLYMQQGEEVSLQRITQPQLRAVGKPKRTILEAQTLGHMGFVVVGFLKNTAYPERPTCFLDREGHDILVYGPPEGGNHAETIKVYVSENPYTGPWHQLEGKKSVVDGINNFIPFDMKDAPLKKAYWIKVEDGNSRMVRQNPWYSGAEVAAVKILHLCHEELSAK